MGKTVVGIVDFLKGDTVEKAGLQGKVGCKLVLVRGIAVVSLCIRTGDRMVKRNWVTHKTRLQEEIAATLQAMETQLGSTGEAICQ
jgi:hypothetical protein